VLAVAARGAVGGFDLKNIGKAIKDVRKDPSKVKDAVEHVAEDPSRLIGEASKAATENGQDVLQGASDLAQEATGVLPAITVSGGGGGAAPAPEPEKQAPPPTSANASAKEDQAGKMKDAVKESSSSIASLLSGKKIEDALKGVTGGKVVDAITKADPSKIEDAARHVAEGGQKIAEAAKDASVKDIASAVTSEVGGSTGSVVDQAKSALDRTGMTDPDSALDKAKQVLDKAKEAKDVSLGDLAGKAKSTSVADLKDAAAAAKNPKEFLDNIGKTKAVKPVGGGGEDKGSEEGGSSGFAVVFLILLAVGGYVLFTRLTQPRQVGRPMLSDDYGAEGTAMTTGHWMGASARDMMGTSGAAEFNRF